MAELIGVPVGGVIFTSGASESASILIDRLSQTTNLSADEKSHSCVRRYSLNPLERESESWFFGIAVNNETGIVEDDRAEIWDVTQALCKVGRSLWKSQSLFLVALINFMGPLV